YFVLDEANQPEHNPRNWWNIYRYDGKRIEPVTSEIEIVLIIKFRITN
ncbi:unnamed protein product, partial [marine sediment metagenome]